MVSFIFYLFFLCCLGYALIQASTVCDSNIWLYQNPTDWARGVCEVICLFYLMFFLFNEGVEFIIEWTQVYEENKDKVEEAQLTVNYLSDAKSGEEKTRFSFFFVQWRNIVTFFHKLDEKLYSIFFSAFPEYFDGVYNFIDWLGLISFFFLILMRATVLLCTGWITLPCRTGSTGPLQIWWHYYIVKGLPAFWSTTIDLFITSLSVSKSLEIQGSCEFWPGLGCENNLSVQIQ